jgi:hypothetical protein
MKIISPSRIQSSSLERDFLKSVTRAFSKFGENRTFLVFQKFETDYNLSRDQIFENPELFSKTLRNIFRFGSTYIEKAIVAELRTDFALPEKEYHGLKDAVSEIRKSLAPA